MNKKQFLRCAMMASAAVLVLGACSGGGDVSSPGTATTPISPPPPPPPPPTPPASTIDLVPAAGCPTGTSEETFAAIAADGLSDIDVCVLGGASGSTTITSDVTIPANSTIALQGPVFIGQDGGTTATLSIAEGVRFFGAAEGGSATASDDYLVVSRGSAIEAVGTETAPIRFTSRTAINDEEIGTSLITETSNAQWGGLVINGFAPINACDSGTATGGAADCEKTGEGASGLFGGDQAADDSGTLRYVIVEYAGARLTNNDELNGIAFQGVGSGTEVDFVQVHNNLDDGIEWFGGTVNAKHIVITGAGDDSLDWTDGWTGKVQFAAVRSNIPTSGDPRGIEGDNLSSQNDAMPFSDPKIANFTLIGSPANNAGAVIRRGTRGTFINGIMSGFPIGLDVDSTQTFTNFADGTLVFEAIAIDADETFASDTDGVPVFAEASNVRGISNSLVDTVFPGTVEQSFPASAALASDSFFEAADYAGAFSSLESDGNSWANFALDGTLVEAVPASCPTGTIDAGNITENASGTSKLLCQIDGSSAIDSDLRLSNGNAVVYELLGQVFVGVDAGADPNAPLAGAAVASLTIDAGVTVVAADSDDYLVVARGSQLFSNGTEAKPVVFTSKGAFDGSDTTVNDNTKGLWGGLVINGRAPINACDSGAAIGGAVDCEKTGEGASGLFGGASSADDSGQIFYTRIQYAGARLTNNDELNGLALQGVGSGTQIEHVQVYNNLDDAFEFFGGTVSAKNLVALGVGDDSFDWTDGWQGSLQYAIAYPGVADATGGVSADPRGIEGDNLSSNNAATPVSAPRVSNVTLISSSEPTVDTGVVLRRGMEGTVVNVVAVGWPDAGLDVDSSATVANVADGSLEIESFFLSGNGDDLESDGEDAVFVAADNMVTGQAVTLSGFAFQNGQSGLVPGANEMAVPSFDVTGIGNLEAAPYVGAVEDGNDQWYLGWTVAQDGTLTAKTASTVAGSGSSK